jgi:hypothetical protein
MRVCFDHRLDLSSGSGGGQDLLAPGVVEVTDRVALKMIAPKN